MRIFNFSSASWSRLGRGETHSPDIICPLPQDKMTSFLTDTSRPALCLLLGPFPPLSHCTTATAVASCLTSIPLLQLSCPFLSTASGKLFIFFFFAYLGPLLLARSSSLSSQVSSDSAYQSSSNLLAFGHSTSLWSAVPKSGRRIQAEAFSSKSSRRMISHILHMAILFIHPHMTFVFFSAVQNGWHLVGGTW